jgi:hypothetical protein
MLLSICTKIVGERCGAKGKEGKEGTMGMVNSWRKWQKTRKIMHNPQNHGVKFMENRYINFSKTIAFLERMRYNDRA